MQKWVVPLLISTFIFHTSCRQKRNNGDLQRSKNTTPYWAIWIGNPTLAVRSCEKYILALRNGLTEAQTLEDMVFTLNSSVGSKFYEDPYCIHPKSELTIAKDQSRVAVYFLADYGGDYSIAASPTEAAFPPASMIVSVNGSSTLEPSEDLLNFGTVKVGENKIMTVTLTNTGTDTADNIQQGVPLIVSPFRFSGNAYPGTEGDCSGSLEAGESCQLALEYAPDEVGNESQVLTLNFSDEVTSRSIQIDLVGQSTAE